MFQDESDPGNPVISTIYTCCAILRVTPLDMSGVGRTYNVWPAVYAGQVMEWNSGDSNGNTKGYAEIGGQTNYWQHGLSLLRGGRALLSRRRYLYL